METTIVETLTAEVPEDLQESILHVLERACRLERKIATAESCTGGLVASLLTDVEGCSHAFERGYVSYTNEAKTDMLGVPPALLAEHGAVSKAVALAMAEGALEKSGADFAFAVTGFAGPARDSEEGLVHFACARRGGETLHREEHYGPIGRSGVRLACLRVAIEMFSEALE